MFDETLRALRQLEQGMRISIDLPLDEKGSIDRRCPSSECGRHFKVVYEDWREKVPDERAFCPYCRFEQDPQDWNTSDQEEHIRSVGLAHVQGIIDRAMQSDARRQNMRERSRPRRGLIDISMTMDFKPGPRPLIVPLSIAEALRQDFTCEACACRWSSLGSSFFCPACGHNSAAVMFDRTIATVRRMIEHIPSITGGFADADTAQDAIRQIMEDQLGRLVGAFERLGEALRESVPATKRAPKKGNIFQRIDDASEWWRVSTGSGYDSWLRPAELTRIRVLYQRRHLLVHRQGIVDQSYLDRSGDSAYRLSQRIVVRAEDVSELAGLLEKLAAGLRSAIQNMPPTTT
ncbi:hypothetical protein RAS2_20190 [Phycisphaerae bacterium RAS2]|nr:hypothetical protein RAS2_20190 [Phycisphaerae bacterium RAS2]